MKIIKDFRNELLKRREIVIEITDNKNPGFSETRKKISEKLSVAEEKVDVSNIISNFGKRTFIVIVNIYDSENDLQHIKNLEITRKKRKELSKSKYEKKEIKKESDELNQEKSKEVQ